ncbi:DUF2749 domain-containing protein [Rhizobium sp. 2YAF20]|uniref:DUF2749 domain-containing protein n=1 Tax=Rhizobium sp. 2YAF20 TaxID=3233027 RepID=UPI003F9C9B71
MWLLSQFDNPSQPSSGSAASGLPASNKRRKRGEKFFGGQMNYHLAGGQEMKPRW